MCSAVFESNLDIFVPISDKDFKAQQGIVYKRLQERYGDLVRLAFPGLPPVVMTFDPEDVKAVYKADGKYPFQPAFDVFRYYRKVMRSDIYPNLGEKLRMSIECPRIRHFPLFHIFLDCQMQETIL